MLQQKNPNINFKGCTIGNGLVSAYWQYPQYAVFSLENKLINQVQYAQLKVGFSTCQSLIQKAPWEVAYIECQDQVTEITGNPPTFNVYDYKLPCDGPLCYNFTIVDDFLAQNNVQEALGVVGDHWSECNDTVHQELLDDWLTDESSNVAFILSQGYPVLVYSGDLDFICNFRGGQAWTNEMSWSGQSEFQNANYTARGTNGEYKTYGGFTFYRVYNAGHMVPMDQPAAALDLINSFIQVGGLSGQPGQ